MFNLKVWILNLDSKFHSIFRQQSKNPCWSSECEKLPKAISPDHYLFLWQTMQVIKQIKTTNLWLLISQRNGDYLFTICCKRPQIPRPGFLCHNTAFVALWGLSWYIMGFGDRENKATKLMLLLLALLGVWILLTAFLIHKLLLSPLGTMEF